MSMLFVFTGLGLLLFIVAIGALIWSIRSGQLDDLDTPAMRLLSDDAAPRLPESPIAPTSPAPATVQPPKTP